MVGFKTITGSTYYINKKDKCIYNEKLGNEWLSFQYARIIVGERAEIKLANNCIISTSRVVSYF